MKSLKAISLFSGAGGFDLGMEAAGFSSYLCTDIDYHSCQTLINNKLSNNNKFCFLKNANIIQKNIKEYSSDEILNDAKLKKEEVSIIYGGPPCQSFSIFGQRRGMDDPRGTLLYEYLRVIRDILPDTFIFENVAGLLTIDNGKVFNNFINDLKYDNNGINIYNITYYLLDTVYYGVPEYRSRIIIFGSKDCEISCPPKSHYSEMEKDICNTGGLLPPVTVNKALSGLPEAPNYDLPNHVGRMHGEEVVKRYSSLKYGQRDTKTRINRLNPNKPSFTIVVGSDKGGGKGHVHPYLPREVTPRESARIQTFPDFWEFSGTSRHPIRQIGNAVPPLVALKLGLHVMKEVFKQGIDIDHNENLRRLGLNFLI